jgi:hypothetical protein
MALVLNPTNEKQIGFNQTHAFRVPLVLPYVPTQFVPPSPCEPSKTVKFSDTVVILTYQPKEERERKITLKRTSLFPCATRTTIVSDPFFDVENLQSHTKYSTVVLPHNPASQSLGSSIYVYHEETSQEVVFLGASLEDRLEFLRERIEEEPSMRLKAQIFFSLYDPIFYKNLSRSCSDIESCKALMREFFSQLAQDVQEDIKHSIWHQLGSPDTLGSDFGYEKFMESPDNAVSNRAVRQAIFRPRYHPTTSSEALEHQIESIIHYVETHQGSVFFSEVHLEKRKLYVFQAFELAACGVSDDLKRTILAVFNEVFDFYEKKAIYSKTNEFAGIPSNKKDLFEEDPFSGSALRAIRLEKQNLLNIHFS